MKVINTEVIDLESLKLNIRQAEIYGTLNGDFTALLREIKIILWLRVTIVFSVA
jgi:hypothetical protein